MACHPCGFSTTGTTSLIEERGVMHGMSSMWILYNWHYKFNRGKRCNAWHVIHVDSLQLALQV